MKTLLIIGGGIEQVRAYEVAKAMGYHVVGSDIDPAAPALPLADDIIVASTRAPHATRDAAVEYHSRRRIHGVTTLACDVPLTVATVAHALGLPGISMGAGRIASDKILMHWTLVQAGVPVPPYGHVLTCSDIIGFADEHGYPVVVKPVDGRGSRGVTIVHDEEASWSALDTAQAASDVVTVMVESYVPGMQISTEGMMLGGEYYHVATAERDYSHPERYAPRVVEEGGLTPARVTDHQRVAIEDVVEASALAMGVTDGPIKGDLVLTEDGPVVLEMAPRLSGGYFCSHQIPLATGVDLVEQTIRMAMWEPIDVADIVPRHLCYVAVRHVGGAVIATGETAESAQRAAVDADSLAGDIPCIVRG